MTRTRLYTALLCLLLCGLLLCAPALAEDSGDFTIDGYGRLTAYTGTATEVTVPEGVTQIAQTAFYNNTAITKVVLPEGVTTIAGSAFKDCSALEEISLPQSLTSIGTYCFSGSGLKSVALPSGLKSISHAAFMNCPQLAEVIIPEGVETIGRYAFQDDPLLESITLPDTVTSLGSYAFSGCTGLTDVTLPEGVTLIDSSTFEGCTALESINLPEGLKEIEYGAFKGCTALSSITLPQGLETIGVFAFYDCDALQSIVIPDSVTTIDGAAFSRCDSLTQLTLPAGFTEIPVQLCLNCSKLKNVNIPEGVTSIGEKAFFGCGQLEGVVLPEGLESIGDDAFAYCHALTGITIPNTLTTIGKQAFASCFALANMHLPEGLTTIGELAFDYCSSLTTLTLPESVTRLDQPIGDGYYDDRGIQTVVLPRSITYLPDAAFGDILTTVYCWRGTYGDQWARQYAPIIIYLDDYGPESFTTLTGPEGTLYFDVGDVIDFTPDLLITPRLNTQTYTFYCGSSNSAVAKGSGAKVEMLSPGSAVITMKIRELPGVTCRINVKVGYPVTSFSLPAAVAVKWSDVNAGSDWQLVPANLKPEGANPVMHWVPAAGGSTVTNDIIDGEVYRLTDADYIIAYGHKAFSVTATSRSGVSRTCRVHLYNDITGLRTGLGMNLQVGKTATANVLLLLDGTPVAGLTDLYTLTSSAPGVVKVLADGQLKALKTGTATITAATTDGRYSATFTVKAFKAQQLPAALTEIGPEAFAGSSFAAVMVPDGCTAIGSKAFANCTALERIYIPASVTTIAPDAFDGCHPIICAPAGSAAAAFGAAAGFTVEPY